jgi:hypothetical protein
MSKIPPPATITNEQADALNLISKIDFICGQNFIDKPIVNQQYAIVCIEPCKDATPDCDGNFAFSKVRGTYKTIEEAEDAAKEIVKFQDQLCINTIVKVGQPFPIRIKTGLPSSHVVEVDIKGQYAQNRKHFVKQEREEDERVREELLAKEKALKEEVTAPIDDRQDYCMLRSKLAHWSLLIADMMKNIKEFERKLIEGDAKVQEIDKLHPEYQNEFLEIIQKEEATSGFVFGKTKEMDDMLNERRERLLDYKKFVPHLF